MVNLAEAADPDEILGLDGALERLERAEPKVAAHRRTEPGRLSAVLRGDLDWIAMRALDKDRGRR